MRDTLEQLQTQHSRRILHSQPMRDTLEQLPTLSLQHLQIVQPTLDMQEPHQILHLQQILPMQFIQIVRLELLDLVNYQLVSVLMVVLHQEHF
jgi:hypothetical protein